MDMYENLARVHIVISVPERCTRPDAHIQDICIIPAELFYSCYPKMFWQLNLE